MNFKRFCDSSSTHKSTFFRHIGWFKYVRSLQKEGFALSEAFLGTIEFPPTNLLSITISCWRGAILRVHNASLRVHNTALSTYNAALLVHNAALRVLFVALRVHNTAMSTYNAALRIRNTTLKFKKVPLPSNVSCCFLPLCLYGKSLFCLVLTPYAFRFIALYSNRH